MLLSAPISRGRTKEKLLTRKRKRDESQWKIQKRKKMRNLGQSYVTQKGKYIAPKSVQAVNCKCRNDCKKFTDMDRQTIFDNYWALGTYERQRDFLVQNVHKKQCMSQKTHVKQNRNFYFEYTFNKDGTKSKVCKQFFLKTLDLGKKTLSVALEKRIGTDDHVSADRRGRAKGYRKIKDQVRTSIRHHIDSYPVMEPHYVRKETNRKYLESRLSVPKMHDEYMEVHKENIAYHCKLSTYRYIFNNEYNLSFHVPKKDQCLTCTKYHSKEKYTDEETAEYDIHIALKDEAKAEKESDKRAAGDDASFASYTMDLQSVLYTPCSAVSSLYYSRKLCVYNFTVYDQESKNGVCYIWNECDGKRGSTEIGTCLFKHLCSIAKNKRHVSLFSDSCGGQNRNQYVVGAAHFALNNCHLERVDLKFLVSGHTSMEVDSMHSAIETSKKYGQNVYIPEDWYNIIRSARRKTPYVIVPIEYDEFMDFKTYTKQFNMKTDANGKPIKWNKIRQVTVEKDLSTGVCTMGYKYDFQTEITSMQRRKKATRRLTTSSPEIQNLENVVKQSYTARIPISAAKKSDLLKLCTTGAIPPTYEKYYSELPSCEDVHDRLPSPDVEEEEDIETDVE